MGSDISIVILAAGKGSRMKSDTPKVLHKICGKEMLYFSIKAACEISDDVIVVVAHQKERVVDAMSSYFSDITFITQDLENFPGTGGAMKNVSTKYSDVLVLNGDMPLVTQDSIKQFLDSKSDITMSVLELENPSGYGRVVIENDRVIKIVEQKDASTNELAIKSVNAGVYAFKNSVLERYIPKLSNNNAQGEYYLTDIIELAVADNLTISPLIVDSDEFSGVNSKYDLANAEMIMSSRIKKAHMQNGVIMQLPDSVYIEEGVKFSGECIVENGVRICGNSKIINSHIKAHSVIEDSTIEDSDIGPLAHIRPLSNIKSTHIGNFVEVKKSDLNGIKAGHLSYIGDAIIDEGTNIGAGTITCNYDGIKKYTTKIGKNVFIGSDTQLVAPIEIADNTMIAAGTTVTSGTYEGDTLLVSRNPIKKVSGFYSKFFGSKK